MILSLTGLRAVNAAGTRTVGVIATNDAVPVTATFDFMILGENHPVTESLGAGESKFVSVKHQKSGQSFVVVTASGSQASTTKFLDLDADSSS